MVWGVRDNSIKILVGHGKLGRVEEMEISKVRKNPQLCSKGKSGKNFEHVL